MIQNLLNHSRLSLVFIFYWTFPMLTFAQNILWQRCIGGDIGEIFNTAAITGDGGAIAVGTSSSQDGDLTNVPQDQGNGVWLVKFSANQNIEWQKRFGSSSDDEARSIFQTPDGGYLVAGFYRTTSLVTACTSGKKMWIVKLSPTGTIEWRKCFGGTEFNSQYYPTKLLQTSEGGYVLVGGSTLSDCSHSGFDGFVLKLSASFNIEWEKCLGGSSADYLSSIVQTTDGGYIVAGNTNSTNGDINDSHGGSDAWVVKLSSSGVIEWKKCYGGTKNEEFVSVVQTSDGNFVLGGNTLSDDGDVVGQHGLSQDVWLIKISKTGTILWQKCFGGEGWEQANGMMQTTDGAFALAGYTDSDNNGDVSAIRGVSDAWLLKASATGVLQWQKPFGGSKSESFRNVIQTADNNFMGIGYTYSNDGDICPRSSGNSRGLLVKFYSRTAGITKSIAGFVERTDAACQSLLPPQYQANTGLKIEKNNATYYTSSDSVGRFGIIAADTGRFTLTAIPPNHLWRSCSPQTVNVLNPNIQDTTKANPRLYINSNCPLMEVQLTTPFLVRCFQNQYYIDYVNRGTAVKNNAVLEFNLDTALTFVSSSRTVNIRIGNKFTFNLGNVGIGEQGRIVVAILVNCNNPLGLIHCSSAVIPNVLPCETALDTLPTVTTPCLNSCRDSVAFMIQKPISGQNSVFRYQLFADYFVIDTGRLNLVNPVTIKHVQDGRTFRLEVYDLRNQLVAARFIQNNSRNATIITGIGTQFTSSIKLSNIADNCTFNRGSFDPNDKTALPQGVGTNHLIEQGTLVDYLVRFQNTGTFTAFNIVVKDTLQSHFDLSSLKITAKSHPATWQLDPKGILTMTFKDINLVDSFTNERASHGFFRYQVRLKDSIATGTKVQNRAAIYFDFNEPVITDNAEHTIGKELVKNCLAKPSLSISAINCANKNVTFVATPKSGGASPTYDWFRNNETLPLSKNASFTLTNAINGTKIYCKMTASSDLCTETPVVVSDTLTINCINTSTWDMANIQVFDLYPNPNQGMFDVKINLAKSTNVEVSLLNTLGQVLQIETRQTAHFFKKYDVSHLPNGIYFIKLNVDGQVVTKKIMVYK
jgi:hypothetical protein